MTLGGADLLAQGSARIYNVGVKATALQGFQQLYERDLDADFVVWLSFGPTFLLGRQIDCYVAERIRRFIPSRSYISLKAFIARTGASHVAIDYKSL